MHWTSMIFTNRLILEANALDCQAYITYETSWTFCQQFQSGFWLSHWSPEAYGF